MCWGWLFLFWVALLWVGFDLGLFNEVWLFSGLVVAIGRGLGLGFVEKGGFG